MPQAISAQQGHIVGREAELALLGEFVASVDSPLAFVLTGGPGIGKTSLWEHGVGVARRGGLRVLAARGSGAEAGLSFGALIDLLEDVDLDEFPGLPPPQRHALDVALFRAESTGAPLETQAIALGLLNTLRALAERGLLLIAVDDTQWLDRSSGDALAFAARRLDAEPVGFVLARRPGSPPVVERALGERVVRSVEVRPLSIGATRRILSERLGLTLPRHLLRRVYEATLGNPLFALELGRSLQERGPLEIGEDVPLPDTVEELLGTRVAALPAHVRRLLLAVALNGDLRASQAADIAPAALDEAVDLGVVVVDSGRVRPAHPLFATAAKSRARVAEERELHLALAGLAGDEESRAAHLALAADQPDEQLAAAVASAAAAAAGRGAPRAAVPLAEHALRLTPPASSERTERLLALGGYLVSAGEAQRLSDLLVPEIDTLPRGAARARAFVLLTNGAVGTNDEIRRYLHDALAESGDDAPLRASVLVEIAENDAVIRVERIRAAEASALEALEVAPLAGPELERPALFVLGWARALGGRPIDDLCDRFRAISDVEPYTGTSPERVAGQRLMWRGEVGRARAVFERLLALADERGELWAYVLQRLHMCELELRTGDCEAAARILAEWGESAERVMWSMYERCHALLAAQRGLPEEAEQWAAATVAGAQTVGNQWDRLEALRALGMAALLKHEPERAAQTLREVWDHKEREGVFEPGVFPVAPDLVEALVELGDVDGATAVTDRLCVLAREQDHPWGLVTVERCRALVRLASEPYDEAAATGLASTADAYGALGLRFHGGRSLLALGRTQRRLRKWGAARSSLERAAAEFDELGSPGWAEEARSELARVGGRRKQEPGSLTPTEQRVVELAAEGLANKEIARELHVSVRTVEVHLKHAYEKLGVRSRTQLARRLSERK